MVELGANVIKIEMTPAGDMGRSLPRIKDGRSAYGLQQNRGKRSICVDLKDPPRRCHGAELRPRCQRTARPG